MTLSTKSTCNKAQQHQSLRSLDSLALAPFVHGFAIIAQKPQSQVCRCGRRYVNSAQQGSEVQQRVVIGIFLTSVVVALITLFFGHETSAQYVAAPALILSGLVALGHLVTLDDDAPGEWSNSEGSNELWRNSLIELAIKLIVFAAVGVIFYV